MSPQGRSEKVLLQCVKPWMRGVMPFGCGQCNPCRVARKRAWVTRGELERAYCGEASFCTFTFSDKFLPADGNLDKSVIAAAVMRLRKAVSRAGGPSFRPWGPDEYGDRTFRPHHHRVLFGLGVQWEAFIRAAWVDVASGEPLGFVDVKPCDRGAIAYCAAYCVKKMNRPGDRKLAGRVPESFSYPKPGLGVPAMRVIAESLRSPAGEKLLASYGGDVPDAVGFGRRQARLDRLCKGELRKLLGLDAEALKARARDEFHARCLAGQAEFGRVAWLFSLPHVDHQRIRQREARERIHMQRRSV